MVLAALAMFLNWASVDVDDSLVGPTSAQSESVSGFDVNEGQLVFIVSLVTVGIIQLGVRAAWMGSGFVVAIAGRQLLDYLGEDFIDPGVGLWIGTLAAIAAAVLLLMDMVANVERAPEPD